MRSFDDAQGQRWQAALLEASYGHVMLVFSPLQGTEVRQCLMTADNMADAEIELASIDDAGLCIRLTQARAWDHREGVARAQAVYASGSTPVRPVSSVTRRRTDPA